MIEQILVKKLTFPGSLHLPEPAKSGG